MLRLPSFRHTIDEAARTFQRFPLVILDALTGTTVALILVEHEGAQRLSPLFRILLASILGIPLLLSVGCMSEKGRWGRGTTIIGQLAAVLLLVAYTLSVPPRLAGSPDIYYIRFFTFGVALVLFATFAPFLRAGEVGAFWQFNKSLFLRLFTAGLYTGILFAGLSLALAALDNLFGVHVAPTRYGELWVLLVGVFAVWFFLAGLPEDWEALALSADYPKVLRILGQYILVPLVLVYLVILYAYLGKILIDWDWPKGWVGRLILGFSGTGILSLLLLHPIRESAEHTWVRTTSKWFYVLLVPLTVMLFLALLKRGGQYGMTEGRYVGFASCAWLAILSMYFMIGRKKNIKFIPISLCAITMLISAGPWGMFAVSERSQISRLREILEKDGVLENGVAHKAKSPVPRQDAIQISSILQYLYGMHGYDGIQPWFSDRLKLDSASTGSAYVDPSTVAAKMGVQYLNSWEGGSVEMATIETDKGEALELGGYTRMLAARHFYANTAEAELKKGTPALRATKELDSLTLFVPDSTGGWHSITTALSPLAAEMFEEYGGSSTYQASPEKLSIAIANDKLRAKFFFPHLQIKKTDAKVHLVDCEAAVMYALQP
jgi:hypothetical protein